jgi:hypothetical protein
MIYDAKQDLKILKRIQLAIVASKPKMIKGKAVYLGQSYTSLDDAWDWFEDDLNFIKLTADELEAAQ